MNESEAPYQVVPDVEHFNIKIRSNTFCYLKSNKNKWNHFLKLRAICFYLLWANIISNRQTWRLPMYMNVKINIRWASLYLAYIKADRSLFFFKRTQFLGYIRKLNSFPCSMRLRLKSEDGILLSISPKLKSICGTSCLTGESLKCHFIFNLSSFLHAKTWRNHRELLYNLQLFFL